MTMTTNTQAIQGAVDALMGKIGGRPEKCIVTAQKCSTNGWTGAIYCYDPVPAFIGFWCHSRFNTDDVVQELARR